MVSCDSGRLIWPHLRDGVHGREVSWDAATAMVRLAKEVETGVAVKKNGKEGGILKKLGNILTRCQDQGRRRKNKKRLLPWISGRMVVLVAGVDSTTLHTTVSESQWVGLVWFSMGFKYLRFELEAGASHWHGQLIVVRAQKRGPS